MQESSAVYFRDMSEIPYQIFLKDVGVILVFPSNQNGVKLAIHVNLFHMGKR